MTSLTKPLCAALLCTGLTAGCSDPIQPDPDPTPDAQEPERARRFRQIEHLARPGINEALLISEGFLNGYNATAPSFAGVDQATLTAVVTEAKTVLSALYLGACLLNGALGFSPQAGVKPAGLTCHATGTAIWVEDSLPGVTLTDASKAAMMAYADKVFAQFIPDVMRLDTSLPASGYLALCGDASSAPLLCGGRFLNDDTIDTTYNYLLAGAAIGKGPFDQFTALVTDGVNFSTNDADNRQNGVTPVPNPQQGHPAVSTSFPYAAAPL